MKVVLQNLTKIFPSRDKKAGKEVVAVNDFTFEIPDGKLIGLLDLIVVKVDQAIILPVGSVGPVVATHGRFSKIVAIRLLPILDQRILGFWHFVQRDMKILRIQLPHLLGRGPANKTVQILC